MAARNARVAIRYLASPSVVAKSHKATVIQLYRELLVLGARFPDDVASDYIIWRTRNQFHRRADETSYEYALDYLKEARQAKRALKSALDGNVEMFASTLELAYGARGRLSHVLKAKLEEVSAGKYECAVGVRTASGSRFRRKIVGYHQPLPPFIQELFDLKCGALAVHRQQAGKPVMWVPQRLPPLYAIPDVLKEYLQDKLEGKPRHIRRLYRSLLGFSPSSIAHVADADEAPCAVDMKLPLSSGVLQFPASQRLNLGGHASDGGFTSSGTQSAGKVGRRRLQLRLRPPAPSWGSDHLMGGSAVLDAAQQLHSVKVVAPRLGVVQHSRSSSGAGDDPVTNARSLVAKSFASNSVGKAHEHPLLSAPPHEKRRVALKWGRQFDFVK